MINTPPPSTITAQIQEMKDATDKRNEYVHERLTKNGDRMIQKAIHKGAKPIDFKVGDKVEALRSLATVRQPKKGSAKLSALYLNVHATIVAIAHNNRYLLEFEDGSHPHARRRTYRSSEIRLVKTNNGEGRQQVTSTSTRPNEQLDEENDKYELIDSTNEEEMDNNDEAKEGDDEDKKKEDDARREEQDECELEFSPVENEVSPVENAGKKKSWHKMFAEISGGFSYKRQRRAPNHGDFVQHQ